MRDRKKYTLQVEYKLVSQKPGDAYVMCNSVYEYELNEEEYEAAKEYADAKIDELRKNLKKYRADQDWDELPI